MEGSSINIELRINDAVKFPIEFLNSLNPPGFPHVLILKVGTPVMLLSNLRPTKLCNGTHLCLIAFQKY